MISRGGGQRGPAADVPAWAARVPIAGRVGL